MQVKTLFLALMGVSVAVQGSTIGSRYHDHKAAKALRARQGGFGGGNFGGGGGGNFGGGNFGGQGGGQNRQGGGQNGGQNTQNGGQTTQNGGQTTQNGQDKAAQDDKDTEDDQNKKDGEDGGQDTNQGGGNNGGGGGTTATATALKPENVATGSQQDGSEGAEDGQAKSITDDSNFINFCDGKTLTNGIQNEAGSCNGIPMGDMPSVDKMASTIILFPVPGDEPAADTDFDVKVQINNMELGTFTNPKSTYYSAPQQLGSQGTVIGHTHITIQDLGGSLTPTTPLDASKFVFFKGINNKGDGKGGLTATVTGGLPAGNYRVCTMAGSSNHQPVLMPKAQRGAQDDCVRITIGGDGGGQDAQDKNGQDAQDKNGQDDAAKAKEEEEAAKKEEEEAAKKEEEEAAKKEQEEKNGGNDKNADENKDDDKDN